jgi:hypothetical protein
MLRTLGVSASALYKRGPACILRAAPFAGSAASRGRLFATGAALVGSATALAIASCDAESPSLDAASSQLHSAVGVYSANDPIEDRHVMKETARGDFIAAVFGASPTAQSALLYDCSLQQLHMLTLLSSITAYSACRWPRRLASSRVCSEAAHISAAGRAHALSG